VAGFAGPCARATPLPSRRRVASRWTDGRILIEPKER
jgi:hypothetical protein